MSQGASLPLISQIRIKATERPASLVLTVDPNVQMELQRLRAELNDDGSDAFSSDDILYEVFQWMTCNYEYEFIQPEETGDLTSAPMLGSRDEQGNVLKRWGFMDYQLRSPQDDLADTGKCKFVGGILASSHEEQDHELTGPLPCAVHKNDIKGHYTAKRALEIAATGNHTVLLYGPHGVGKSLLISAFPEASKVILRDSCICGNHLTRRKPARAILVSFFAGRGDSQGWPTSATWLSNYASVPVKEWQVRPDPTYGDCFNRRVAAAREFGKTHLSLDLTDDSATEHSRW